jgi:3-oxoacyl-[acyl-carrier protein] reductase
VLWLSSDDSSFVTGTTIAVDGGRTAGDFTRTGGAR